MFLKEILASFGLDPSLVDPPVRVEEVIYGERNPEFRNFAAPGIMMSIIFFLAIGLTSLIFVVEKKEGLFERIWVTGVKTIEMIIAHLVMKTFIQLIQVVLMITFAKFIFQVRSSSTARIEPMGETSPLLADRIPWFRSSDHSVDLSSGHLWYELR